MARQEQIASGMAKAKEVEDENECTLATARQAEAEVSAPPAAQPFFHARSHGQRELRGSRRETGHETQPPVHTMFRRRSHYEAFVSATGGRVHVDSRKTGKRTEKAHSPPPDFLCALVVTRIDC